jgi:hypothetical protein
MGKGEAQGVADEGGEDDDFGWGRTGLDKRRNPGDDLVDHLGVEAFLVEGEGVLDFGFCLPWRVGQGILDFGFLFWAFFAASLAGLVGEDDVGEAMAEVEQGGGGDF